MREIRETFLCFRQVQDGPAQKRIPCLRNTRPIFVAKVAIFRQRRRTGGSHRPNILFVPVAKASDKGRSSVGQDGWTERENPARYTMLVHTPLMRNRSICCNMTILITRLQPETDQISEMYMENCDGYQIT
jgi:hypothetical protein